MRIYHTGSEGVSLQNSMRYNRIRSNILEREIEEWLLINPDCIDGAPIKWIIQQDNLVDGSRSDLIGIDKDGSIIICEVKRSVINSDAIIQSLRYAAAYYDEKFHEIVSDVNVVGVNEREIEEFLDGTKINESHRIILVGEEIDADALAVLRYLSLGAESNFFDFEVYTFNFYELDKDHRIFSFYKIFPEIGLREEIKIKREIRASGKYARDQVKINWMKNFIIFMQGNDLRLYRSKGQSYEAQYLKNPDIGTDVWISIKYENFICVAVPSSKDVNVDSEFVFFREDSEYKYFKLKNSLVTDEDQSNAFKMLQSFFVQI
jgi:hypothetical protein